MEKSKSEPSTPKMSKERSVDGVLFFCTFCTELTIDSLQTCFATLYLSLSLLLQNFALWTLK